jgi:hypothetical protein
MENKPAIERMIEWLNDHPTMDLMTKSNAINVARIFMDQEEHERMKELVFPFIKSNTEN